MSREDFSKRENGHREGDTDTRLPDEKSLARSAGQDVRRVLDELAIVAGDNQGAIPKEAVRDQFIIELPPVSSGQHGVSDTENQDRMFQLRGEFLKADPEGVYAWVPQAVEAYRRAQKSDLLPDLGVICAIGVNVDTDTVKIMTRSTEAGAVGFDLKLSELATYSPELILHDAEKRGGVPEFKYSENMALAMSKLSPSARFRWDLITRAAHQQAMGNQLLVAAPVSNNRSLVEGKLEGVGVFRKDRARFSLVKVINEDVPLTPYETELLARSSKIPRIHSDDPQVKAFMDLVYNISTVLGDFSKAQPKVSYWVDRLSGVLGKDTAASLTEELRDLVGEFMNARMEVTGLTDFVREEILKAKVTVSDDGPFELKKLSDNLAVKFSAALERYTDTLMALYAFIAKKRTVLKGALESSIYKPTKRSSDAYLSDQHSKRIAAASEHLEKIGGEVKAFEDIVRGTLGAGEGKK